MNSSSTHNNPNPPDPLTHKAEHRRELLGFFFGFLAALSTAVMAVLIKFSSDIPSSTMVFTRFIIGFPFLLPFFITKRVVFSFKVVRKHLFRALAGLATLYCYFYAIKELPLVNAVTLINTQPLFVPLIVLIWTRVLVSKMRFFAISVGFIGVLILLRPESLIGESGSIVGLLGGCLSAIALVGVRLLSKEESTEAILCYYFLIATVFSFFPMLIDWEPIPDLRHWIYLLAIGSIAAIYQYFVTLSYSYAPASKVSMMNYVGVILGGISGWIFFGETPDIWVVIGSLLIIGSAILALYDKTPPRLLKKHEPHIGPRT